MFVELLWRVASGIAKGNAFFNCDSCHQSPRDVSCARNCFANSSVLGRKGTDHGILSASWKVMIWCRNNNNSHYARKPNVLLSPLEIATGLIVIEEMRFFSSSPRVPIPNCRCTCTLAIYFHNCLFYVPPFIPTPFSGKETRSKKLLSATKSSCFPVIGMK